MDPRFIPPCSGCQRHGIVVALSILEETNQSIIAAQKDLLLWHFRLGHMGFAHLQKLMRPRTIDEPSNEDKPVIVDPCIVAKNPST